MGRSFSSSTRTAPGSRSSGARAPIHNAEGKQVGGIGLFQDVSERMQAEEAIRTGAQQLRRALQLSEEVLSIVAHDLRNPLSSIGLRAQSLLRSSTEERQRKHLRVIIGTTRQMNILIEDLLDLARLESGQLRLARDATEIEPLLDQVIEVHRPLLDEAGLRLAVRVAPGLPRIEADAGRVTQVLSNLVGNAIKFTPRGGTITVSAEHTEGTLLISVEDTGCGIGPEQQSHLFERFWQGSPPGSQRGRSGALHLQGADRGPRREDLGRERAGKREHVPLHPP